MIIKVDVDGVIRDMFTPMCKIYNCLYHDNITVDDIYNYDVEKVFHKVMETDGISAATLFFHNYGKKLFLTSKPYEGVRESLEKLRENGHKVVIATWQMTLANKLFTLEFLENNNIPYDDICFTKDKWMVKSDIIIDDNPEFILNPNETAGKILVDKPYNKDCDFNGIRANSLNEAVEIILNSCEGNKKKKLNNLKTKEL